MKVVQFNLLLPHDAASGGIDPFDVDFTNRKQNLKLKLISEIEKLQSEQQKNNSNYLNVYPLES